MSITPKKQPIEPTKQASLIPTDMSWDNFEKMFDNFRSHWPFHAMVEKPFKTTELNLNPNVDVTEDDIGYQVTAELPGLETKDINLNISDNVLTISGEKKIEKEDDKKGEYHLMERQYGYFKRSFSLPPTVDQDNIKAEFKKGILHLTLPKSEKSIKNQRKIDIEG